MDSFRYSQGSSGSESRMMRRGDFLKLGASFIAGAAVIWGVPGGASAQQSSLSTLTAEFTRAARQYVVPVEILLAMGYVNTRWEMPYPGSGYYRRGNPEGRGTYGMMALVQNPSSDTLGAAARLTGLSEESLITDRFSNILGGAALLADSQGTPKPSALGGWYGAVSGSGGYGTIYSAVAGVGGGTLYADQVFSAIQSGATKLLNTGEHINLHAKEALA